MDQVQGLSYRGPELVGCMISWGLFGHKGFEGHAVIYLIEKRRGYLWKVWI
jgi:hypothetical protein